MKKSYIPNLITCVRILGTIILLFVTPMSREFFVIYTIAGASDALDGFAARMLKASSEFGSKLDSIADLLFYAVMLLKIFPILWKTLPKAIWVVVAVILLIRICIYAFTAIKYKEFASVHTYMNKVTSALIFLVPYFITRSIGKVYCWLVCASALLAGIEELIMHIRNKEYSTKQKTLLKKNA